MHFELKEFVESLEGLPLEAKRAAILARRDILQGELNSLKYQMDASKAEHHRTGDYADAGWWARINAASRTKGHQMQRLQAHLSQISAELKQQRVQTHNEFSTEVRVAKQVADRVEFANRFVRAAKILMSKASFDKICDVANNHLEDDNGPGSGEGLKNHQENQVPALAKS